MKNIFESEMKRFDEREIGKAIEWLGGHGFSFDKIRQNFVYRSFVKNAARPPDEEIGVFDVLDIGGQFHGDRKPLTIDAREGFRTPISTVADGPVSGSSCF